MLKDMMTHLPAALGRRANNGLGSCFYRAAALTLDQKDAVLCIGTFAGANVLERHIPNAADQDFIHAWVEVNGQVYAPSLLSPLQSSMGPIDRAEYYQVNGVRNVHYITHDQLVRLSDKWGISDHLLNDANLRRGKKLPVVLLDAAGVSYRVLDDGGIVPLQAEVRTMPA